MAFQMSINYIFPYHAVIYDGCNLLPHKHYDIEIIYSKKGSVFFTLDRKNYELNSNQMIIINSLVTHSSNSECPGPDILLLKVGFAFLRELFPAFSAITPDNPVIDLSDENNEWQKKTKDTLDRIYDNLQNSEPYSALMIQSDLYRLSYYILEMYRSSNVPEKSQHSQYVPENKLEEVIQYIYNNYHENITVEDAAKISGYTKEYFCKIFKQLTAESFHQFLNRVRIEQAKFLIANTPLSISEISNTVGIKDDSTFRTVFKKFTQTTPTDYRKRYSEK